MTFFDDKAFTINDLVAAVIAIEQELGVTPSGVYADVRTRLDIVEARINNPLAPAPSVLNPFFIANTGVTIQAGFGNPNSVLALPSTPGSIFLREDGYNNQGLYSFRPDGYWHQIDTDPWTAAGDLSGTQYTQTVVGIRNKPVPTPSGTNTVLTWNGSTLVWVSASGFTAAGDLSGTSSSQTVVGLQGRALSAAAPSDGYVLTWVAAHSDWEPVAPGSEIINLFGDVTGTTAASVVAKVNGASAPAAGSLTTGNVLQVNGASSLTYGAVNLAGGANFVTGVLPTGNQAAQSLTLTGDTTGSGTTTSTTTTVAKINGATVPAAGALTTGNGLYVSGASALSYSALNLAGGANFVTGVLPAGNQAAQTMGGDVTGTTAASTVAKIQNIAVVLTSLSNGQVLEYNGTNWVNASVSGGVTWANDLVNSTNTNQYVSSLSFNGTAGGGTININGTSTVLQWAANTLPVFNQATVAGTGTNNGVAFTIKAQAGQQQTGATANNNGGNLVLDSGSAGTGGSGAAGVAGNIQLNTDGVTQVTISPTAVTLAEKINWATATVPNLGYSAFAIPTDANFTPSSSQYNANELAVTSSVSLTATRNLVLPLTQGGQWIIYNNTTGGQSIQAIGTSGTGFSITDGYSALVWTDGTNFYGVSGSSTGGGGSFTAAGDLSGTSTSQTVIGIRNNSVPTLPSSGSGNSSLIWNGASFAWGALGTTSIRLTPTDTNTIIHWTLDEATASFANTGTGGTTTLTTAYGTHVVPGSNGLFGSSVGMLTSGLSSTGASAGTDNVEPNATACTVSAWVWVRNYVGNALVVAKNVTNAGTWSATPFIGGVGLSFTASTDGTWFQEANVNGTLSQTSTGAQAKVPIGEWTLMATTWDGTNLRSYLNGNLVLTTPVAGTNLGFGTHGPWYVGGTPPLTSQDIDGFIDDVRVESVVRSQTYLQTMYKQGVGLADVVLISDAQVSPTAAIQGTKISPNFGSQAITTTGTATLGSTAVTALSTSLITNSGKSVYTAISAPTVSGSAQAAIYFDSSSNQLLISQNAGNYVPVVGNVQVVSTTYLVLTTDSDIFTNLNSSAFTVTLPATPARVGEKHTFKDYLGKAATNNLTISGNGNNIEQFGGTGTAATLVLNSNFDAVTLEWNGTTWSIM